MPRLNHPSASYPSTGAELLEDLHRRLQAQSINGTLPRRPKTTSLHRHRKIRKSRHKINCIPQPDLLPTSAFNHPSRHTQYHLVQLPSSSQILQPQPIISLVFPIHAMNHQQVITLRHSLHQNRHHFLQQAYHSHITWPNGAL